MTEQATWDAFSPDTDPEPDPEPERPVTTNAGLRNTGRTPFEHNPEFEDYPSCPWCLAPGGQFKQQEARHIGDVACRVCETVQPTDAEWYWNGEKVTI